MITYTYDECNRLSLQKVVDRNGTVIAQYQYTLGAGGERTKVTETGACGSVEAAYDYDNAGRLIKETIQKGEETTTYKYDYDDVGNRIEKRENSKITKYTYNSRNQLITEKTGTQVVTYSYDANGNLLNQSGAGKTVTYTYDVYNRLIWYAEGEKKESYTYDAEGVRRSKVNGEDTIYYVSDTTGSLSYTLAETDKDGNIIATYNRADVLTSQVRGEESSYYLFDGHGDVRALINDDGRITDKYCYSAYGELIERSGETENHYLYTGEYYDGTSNLYYLRARYMNPSTGTFISMDTYEGSIYDPDTLHKYLYANGNPVKYSDPTGNFFSGIGSFMATTIQTTLNNAAQLHVMGVISGVTSSAITTFLGGSTDDAINAFIVGYIGGFGMGAVLCVAAAYSAIVFAKIYLAVSFTNVIMTVTMMVYSIFKQKEKYVIVYAVLSIIALMNFYQAYSLYGSIVMTGDKGSITIGFDNNDPDNPTFNGKKIGQTQYGNNSISTNQQTLLDALKDAPVEYRKNPRTGEMEPYMKQIQVTEDYKLILRRDIGDFNHGDLDHWNLEVQTIGGGNVKYDLHLYIGDDGNLLPFTEDNVYIPKKSPFN
ncbi:MAG: RHS repeat-associated core domain-containing protein [Lachnospiraceae bacterium]|nr:RHS repeat-associated core domain-containing protein [Lachnospiraceae bacterium]